MPIFEYICSECSHRFEQLVAGRKTRILCPACGSSHVEKQFSSFAAHGGGTSATCEGGCPYGPDSPYCPPGGCCGEK